MNEHHDNLPAGGLATFLTGVIVGAALTYLFGTKSGQKIKAELIKEGAKALDNLKDEFEEHEEEVKEKLEEGSEEIKEKLTEGIEGVKEVTEHIPDHIENIQKKGRHFFFKKSKAES
ncbi:hypothetical protein A2164_01620 [Candidatus Curtissbacteria bacterium RBG_13_35_7]|uniref:YtxH domain-containing protein n=1 Tax=Candidatus Curtissbacteria bacterium RBG_13_35_7 TaxID=1797705 RepID=A0A1F5G2T5_9BACT|nr:MAG: hypothetical protein A2164_01620 [Candidatus Curtissbacteria bacterium RBG_13_35_7]